MTLGSLMRGKPVILNLVYYECPMLCTLVLNGLLSAMRALPFDVGQRSSTSSPSASIPTTRRSSRRRREPPISSEYRRPGAEQGWHFLTGDAASIERSPTAVGFHYRYDPSAREFAHAAGMTRADAERVASRATSTASSSRRAISSSA